MALVVAVSPAGAQQAATSKELQESQRRLEQIRRERAQLRQDVQSIRSRVHDISTELRLLSREVSTSASAIQELDFQVEQHRLQIEQTSQDLITTQRHLEQRRATLNRRLRDIYKRGPLHTAQVLLTADSFSDLLNRYKYLFLIARHDRQLVREVSGLETQLVARERILQSSVLQLQSVQEEKEQEYADLAGLQARQTRALTSARQTERTKTQRLAQLERDERRLAALIATLETRRRETERRAASGNAPRAPAAATLTTADLGALGWPVEGRLVYRFGRQTQPNGTAVRWNGIGIGAVAGSSVKAVEAGSVVMAGPFEGYGPSVVLSHGGGYYSLYLHLRDVSVREGAQVTRNQVVGTVGGEGTEEGAHIEFQIRAPGGEAVDPLTWLRARRAS